MTNKTYCKYPFHQLALKDFRNGELISAWPCCTMGNQIHETTEDNQNRLGIENVNLLTPQEIFDHPRMVELRSNLIAGVRDPACKVCWNQEDRGITSFRQFSHKTEDDIITTPNLEVIDLTHSNICNLRCRMCTPASSNLLMIDHQYFKNNNLLDTLKRVTGDRWHESFPHSTERSIQWQWLINNTKQIKYLKMSGGEPFFDTKVLELLKIYVQNNHAKDTTLMFHTNATCFTDEVIDLISHFKRNDHSLSIDGTNKVYEYIRYPATFSELNTSLNNYFSKLKNLPKFTQFTMVVSALNVLNIAEYIDWCCQFTPNPCFSFAEIYTPGRGIALRHLPRGLLGLAKHRITKYQSDPRFFIAISNLIAQIDDAITNNVENKKLMLDEINLFDLSRNQSFVDFLDFDITEWLTK